MSANGKQPGGDARGAAGPFVRAQLLARLREALDIASTDLDGQFDRFRDLLCDLSERAEALELTRLADESAAAQPTSRLAVTALSQTRGEPVREFLLIPFGQVQVERPIAGESFVFTRQHAESAVRWFQQMGRKLAIDYEHQSFDRLNTRADGLRPAAGWIAGLEVRDDGLWAVDVTWTDRARELLAAAEYRYFSPVIFWTDEDHTDVAALGPVALTNDPAMHGVAALAAAREHADAADDLEPGETDDPWALADEVAVVAREELDAARAEIDLLRRKLQVQAANAFVERGMRLGKIVDSTSMDWREDYLRDAEATEERLARAPVMLPPGRILKLDRRGDVAPLNGPTTTSPVGPLLAGARTIEPEDLAAYERALAGGRVLPTRAVRPPRGA